MIDMEYIKTELAKAKGQFKEIGESL